MTSKNYLLCITLFSFLLLTACKKKKDDPVPASKDGVTALVDGTPFYIEANGLVNINGSATSCAIGDYWELSTGIGRNTSADEDFSITRGFISVADTVSSIQFKSLIAVGKYQYRGILPEAGMVITWKDSNHTEYSTKYGPQEGSKFQIVLSKDETVPHFFRNVKRIIVKFNCKVYTADGNSSKTLTNGTFQGLFANMLASDPL